MANKLHEKASESPSVLPIDPVLPPLTIVRSTCADGRRGIEQLGGPIGRAIEAMERGDFALEAHIQAPAVLEQSAGEFWLYVPGAAPRGPFGSQALAWEAFDADQESEP